LSSSSAPDYRFEFLPEVSDEARKLDEELRRVIAGIVVDLHTNPHPGELMDDRPPKILQGCRKIRFDLPSFRGKARWRLVYRNEPSDGAVGVMLVLAIGRRDRMIAYAKAASRYARRLQEQGRQQTTRRRD
jgi:hypothetical protein